MSRFEDAVNKIGDAANAGLAVLVIGQPSPDIKEVYDRPIQLAQAGGGDALQVYRGERVHGRHGGAQMDGPKIESFGSIESMKLPLDFRSVTPVSDTGYINMDLATFQSQKNADAKIGAWHKGLDGKQVFENLDKIFQAPPHKLSDDEFFSISGDVMTPGPWAGSGRTHEISLRTDVINGRNVLVYDFWMNKDPSQHSPTGTMGPNDIHSRVIFAPNKNTGQMDVIWMQSPEREFKAREEEFNRSLKTITWK